MSRSRQLINRPRAAKAAKRILKQQLHKAMRRQAVDDARPHHWAPTYLCLPAQVNLHDPENVIPLRPVAYVNGQFIQPRRSA